MLIETLIAKPPVETLDERVLGRFARFDEARLDPFRVRPTEHRQTRELRPIVSQYRLGHSVEIYELIQKPSDPPARDLVIDQNPSALPGTVIDHRQQAEPPAVQHLIVDKVHRPTLVRLVGDRDGSATHRGASPALALTHLQRLFSVEPIGLLVVQAKALSA